MYYWHLLLLTACQGQGETKEKTDGDGKEKQASMETAKLADSIRQKYEENYVYAEPIKDVARDEHLKLQMGFDIMNSEFTEYTQIVNVFKDAELTQPSDLILNGMRRQKSWRSLRRGGVSAGS